MMLDQASAQKRLQFYLAEIERQKELNIFWHVDAIGALDAAKQCDARRLHDKPLSDIDGVIIGVKDNIDVAGMPCTAGMKTRADLVAQTDAKVVQLLRAAGAIILGKLSLHEGALGADNDNPHFGACHNPHRFGYTPGGSSGGSAAAIAAGLCDLALGTDTMGSVRIPASYCGVMGFKPSFNRYSQQGLVPACTRLDHVGLLAKDWDLISATDAILALSPQPSTSSAAPRIAHIDLNMDFGIDASVQAIFQSTMEKLLHKFQMQTLRLDAYGDGVFGKDRRAGLLATEAEMAQFYQADLSARPELFSPALLSMLRFGQSKSAADIAAAHARIDAAALRAHAIFDDHSIDVLLTPTTPQTAFAFGQAAPANQADLTSMANFAGLPALSLPMGEVDGLPIGLQLIGRRGFDRPLLGLAITMHASLSTTHKR
jgi:Asp-tRNA(Asn)/Glu-tRNA(Gln) amidotransferase A subunit family amidase